MEKSKAVGREYGRVEMIQEILNQAKGEVCKEFEKVCPTDLAFKRMKKEMHNIFDQLLEELKRNV